MNINKSFIDTLSFSGKETAYFDDSVKGFGVRVCKSSASYILMYRNAYGRQKKLTICKTTLMTPTEARDEAKRLLALVVQGKDPEQEKLGRRKELTIGEHGSHPFAVYVRLRPFFGTGGLQSGQGVASSNERRRSAAE